MSDIKQEIKETIKMLNTWSNNNYYSYSEVNGGYRLLINNQASSIIMTSECLLKRLNDELNGYLFN